VTSFTTVSPIATEAQGNGLEKIGNLDQKLQQHFQDKFVLEPSLNSASSKFSGK
jgi:hypothetical protein